jgi:hypothetical protein
VEDINFLAPCGQLIINGLIAGMPTGDVWGAMMSRISDGLTVSVASIDANMRQSPSGFRGILEGIANAHHFRGPEKPRKRVVLTVE